MAVHPLSLRVLTIQEPCELPWSEMKGDNRTRFCGECRKNVYNIENLSDAEADELLSRSEVPCVRYRRRRDGTLVTRDCSRAKLWGDRLRYLAAACFAAIVGIGGTGCTMGSAVDPAETRAAKPQDGVALMGTPMPPTTRVAADKR